MRIKTGYKLIIAIAVILGIAIAVLAIRSGGNREVHTEHEHNNLSDISISSVHDYRIYLPDTAEEVINAESSSDNDFDNADPDAESVGQLDLWQMDVWDLGMYLYGISYEDTTRTLKIITREGYGGSLLSYYVACCCWVRATERYWGYGDIYQAFGEADESYYDWMDGIEIAEWAYASLWECYIDPTYCKYCNGMAEPYDYIYAEWSEYDGCMIYCWN